MLVAIDARLYGTDSTGDATYWTHLIDTLLDEPGEFQFALLTDKHNVDHLANLAQIVLLESKNSRIWSLWMFPRVAMALKANVIHTQYNFSPLLQYRVVTTIHDVSFFIGPLWFKARDRFLMQRYIPRSVRRADAVITVSETSAQEIQMFIPAARGKTHAIYNGPSGHVHHMVKSEARQQCGIAEPFVLTVGSKWPRKNIQLAIDAMEHVKSPHKLVLTGKSLHGALNLNDRVIETGYVNEETLGALYSAADAYICPSWHEGFGIPLLEAWACECPVVCSIGGALPEIAGDAAVIVNSWDEKDWASAIDQVLQDPSLRSTLIENGKARLQEFSWKTAAEQTRRVYQSVAYDRSPPA